ncbi:hypothetical protein HDU88_008274 [Geranomyces variabilis]|nr:hypothetical protein HDU88_008274 [Geranomyces variabilis]
MLVTTTTRLPHLFTTMDYPQSPFKKGSIFYSLAAADPPKDSARQQQAPPSSTSACPPKSKNSIFDVPHTITKPAVSMDTAELEALRRGEVTQMEGVVIGGGETAAEPDRDRPPVPHPPKRSDSITVPLSRAAVTPRDASFPLPPSVTSPRNDVAAAFLTNANTTSRRGFVELDESLFNLLPPPSSLNSVPSLRRDQQATPHLPQSAPRQNVPVAEQPLKKSAKLLAAEQQAIRKRRKEHEEAIGAVVTSPAMWDNINLTFLPTKRNFLGEGRYAQVFLGYYTVSDEARAEATSPFPLKSPRPHQSALPDLRSVGKEISSPTSPTSPTSPHQQPQPPRASEFLPCAVKRLHHTQEAQSIGLSEVYILRKLSPLHDNIVKFIGVKDEADVDSPKVRAELAAGSGSPAITPLDEESKDTRKEATADPSMHLLVLLEYLPKGNMWDWVERNKQSVGRRLWLKWARQLAGAVECMHAQGIVHHDIKPHNILLSEYLDVRLADFGNACFVPEQSLELPDPPPSPNLQPSPAPTPHAPATPMVTLAAASPYPTPGSHSSPSSDERTPSPPPSLAPKPQPAAASGAANTITTTTSTTPAQSPSLADPTLPPRQQLPSTLLAPLRIPSRSPSRLSPSAAAASASSSATSHPRPPPSPVIPGSPSFPDSQTLHLGLSRGTAPYSAPELFTPALPYSFPVDIYSLGVTLYTVLTATEPFALARTTTQLYMGARRGFFESGLQKGVGVDGIRYPPHGASEDSARVAAAAAALDRGDGGGGGGGESSLQQTAKGYPRARFPNGDPVENAIAEIVHRCLETDPAKRCSASELVKMLAGLDDVAAAP